MRTFFNEGMVEVDGETLTLVVNFRTGQTMDQVLPQLPDPSHSLAAKVLWAMLREKHEGVTLDEAAGVAFGPDGAKVGLVMGDILRSAFNIGAEEKDENPPKRRGRSKSS